MNEPRRLKHGGGAPELLLRSAEADGPSGGARRKAALLASTTSGGGLSRTARTAPARTPGVTLLRWAAVAAAASIPLAYLASRLMVEPAPSHAAAPLSIAPEAPAELRFLEEARAAIARRDYVAALSALDAHDQAAPAGPHRADALRLRALALRETGRAAEASAVERRLPAQSP